MSQHVILIADDEPGVRRIVEASLWGLPVRTIHAGSGDSALAAARRERPALAILDVKMPGPDGIEVCRQLRIDPSYDQMPVIVLTASAEYSLMWRARDAGADAFVAKPFSPIHLREQVQTMLTSADAQPRRGSTCSIA